MAFFFWVLCLLVGYVVGRKQDGWVAKWRQNKEWKRNEEEYRAESQKTIDRANADCAGLAMLDDFGERFGAMSWEEQEAWLRRNQRQRRQ